MLGIGQRLLVVVVPIFRGLNIGRIELNLKKFKYFLIFFLISTCLISQNNDNKSHIKRRYELIGHIFDTSDENNPDVWDAGGLVGRSTENRVFVFDPGFLDGPARRIMLFPINPDKKVLLSAKFRHGAFYRRVKNQIQKFSHSVAKWLPLLDAPVDFAQFDISEDGRIVLIATGEPLHRNQHPIQRRQEDIKPETASLIEIFEPGSREATKKIPYPTEIKQIHQQVRGIWPVDRVWNIRDTLVMWQQSTGVLYRFDINTERLDIPDVPWHNLLNTYFPGGRAKYPAAAGDQLTLINLTAFPIYPQAYPAGNGHLVLAMGRRFIKRDQQLIGLTGTGNEPQLPFPSDLVCDVLPDTPERVWAFVWDLQTSQLKQITLKPKPGPVFGYSKIWIEPDGNWRPFSELMKTLDPPKTKPAEKGTGPSTPAEKSGVKVVSKATPSGPAPAPRAHAAQ